MDDKILRRRGTGLQSLAVLVLAVLTPSAGPAQGKPIEGSALLSDGRLLKGEIELDAPGRFDLFEPGSKRRWRLDPAKVARLLFTVEKEELVQGWMFQEESRNEKIKLAFWRPFRELAVTVVLKTGQRIRGHLDPAVIHLWEFLAEGEKEHRLVVGSHQRGAKGQKLEELLWLRELVLGPAPPETKFAALVLRAPAASVRAVSLEHGVSYGPAREKGGPLRFRGLLPGRVSLFFLAPPTLWAGWPAAAKEPDPAARRRIADKIEDVEEYFDEKKILLLRCLEKDRALALVESRRLGKTTYKNRKTTRWDLYLLREVDREKWLILRRHYLFRRTGAAPGVPVPGVSRVVRLPRFAALALPAAGGEVDLGAVKLEPAPEKRITPEGGKGEGSRKKGSE